MPFLRLQVHREGWAGLYNFHISPHVANYLRLTSSWVFYRDTLDSVEVFHLQDKRQGWSTVNGASLPVPVRSMGAAVVKDKIYVFGESFRQGQDLRRWWVILSGTRSTSLVSHFVREKIYVVGESCCQGQDIRRWWVMLSGTRSTSLVSHVVGDKIYFVGELFCQGQYLRRWWVILLRRRSTSLVVGESCCQGQDLRRWWVILSKGEEVDWQKKKKRNLTHTNWLPTFWKKIKTHRTS